MTLWKISRFWRFCLPPSIHCNKHTITKTSRPLSAGDGAHRLVQPGLLHFNRIKLITMQLCFKFNCTGVDVKALSCLHAACRKYITGKKYIFTDNRARTHTAQASSVFLGTVSATETVRLCLQYNHTWI